MKFERPVIQNLFKGLMKNPYKGISCLNKETKTKLILDRYYKCYDSIGTDINYTNLLYLTLNKSKEITLIEKNNNKKIDNIISKILYEQFEISDNSYVRVKYDIGKENNTDQYDLKFSSENDIVDSEKIKSIFNDEEEYYDELERRRLTNCLIQGAAVKGAPIINMYSKDINNINPELLGLYNEFYRNIIFAQFNQGDEKIDSYLGMEDVSDKEDHTEIKVEGANLIFFMHEIIKGYFEIIGTHSLPDDKEKADMIIDNVDTLKNETWDIRMGPSLYEQYRECLPLECLDNFKSEGDMFYLVNKLNTKEFKKLIFNVVHEPEKAKQLLNNLYKK